MANRFWVGGTGNWTDAANHWATTSGGAPGAGNLPTNADDCFFDVNSNGSGYTVTINGAAVCLSLSFSAPGSGTITWAGSSTLGITGSLTCLSGMTRTYTGAITFNSTSSGRTITMNGVTLGGTVTFNGVGGVWTLQDAFTSSSSITLSNGTLDTNGKAVQSTTFTSTSGTRTLTLGATTWVLTLGSGVFWNVTSSLTLNANTSLIHSNALLTGDLTFTGGGLTYNNFRRSGGAVTGNLIVGGSNTFNDFRLDSASGNLRFDTAAGSTTTTVTSFTVSGSAGLLISIDSTNAANNHNLVKAGGGTITRDFLNISNSQASPADTWFAANSVNGGDNSGWIFVAGVATAGSLGRIANRLGLGL